MDYTNPHFSTSCDAPADLPQDTCTTSADAPAALQEGDTVPSMPRLRPVTNSPAQEYAIRPGKVTPLPDNVAALICSFKGRAEVQRNGIKVVRKELSREPLFYWHEDSLTCLSMQGQKVIYVINPNTLGCIHIMDAQGRYIETVVRKGEPDILDYKAAGKEIGKQRAYLTRQQNRLQELHGEDTDKILERHRNNTEELSRITVTHPAEVEAQDSAITHPPSAVKTTTADRITDRGQSVQTHITDRANQRSNAASLGHSMRDESPATDHRSQRTDSRPEIKVEDFTEKPKNARAEDPAVTNEIW